MKKKGFTLIELLVVIAIIAMLLAILMPALNKVKRLAQRLVCATNCKGLGTAMIVYANDFEDEYAAQGGGYDEPDDWKNRTLGWEIVDKNWADGGNISVGASLFLLVREADVSTKSFVCKSSDQKPYDGNVGPSVTDTGQELVELWDFGFRGDQAGPENCVSYSYQMPYNRGGNRFFPADAVGPAGMALLADRNPFYDPKMRFETGPAESIDPDAWESVITNISNDWDNPGVAKWKIQIGNAYAHNREGQNVLFNDGHAEFTKRSDVGYENDNIYTTQNLTAVGAAPQSDDDIRIGNAHHSVGRGGSLSNRDSWLVNDSIPMTN